MRRMRHASLKLILVLAIHAGAECLRQNPRSCGNRRLAVATDSRMPAKSRRHPAFINKGWKVAPSADGQSDQLYVFLSDGTLLLSAANNKPALGRWEIRDAFLFMIKEGIPIRPISLP